MSVTPDNNEDNNVKIAGHKMPPWALLLIGGFIGIAANNYDAILQAVIPDLKKTFVTHEDIKQIKDDIADIKKELERLVEKNQS